MKVRVKPILQFSGPSRFFNYRIKVFNINYRSSSGLWRPWVQYIRIKKGIWSQFYKVCRKTFWRFLNVWNIFWKLLNRFCLLLQPAAIGSRKALKTTKQLLLHQTHIMSFRGKYLRQYFKRGYVRKLKTSWLHFTGYWGRNTS